MWRKIEIINTQKEVRVKAQEFGGEQVTIDFRFAITDRSKTKTMQSRITFDTHLKNILMYEH